MHVGMVGEGRFRGVRVSSCSKSASAQTVT